jgi:hypothetical protein
MPDGKELGVIATIQKFLDNVGINSFTLEDIHVELVKKFPDRDPDGMMSTIKTQVFSQLSNKKGYAFKLEGKQFIVVPPKK